MKIIINIWNLKMVCGVEVYSTFQKSGEKIKTCQSHVKITGSCKNRNM